MLISFLMGCFSPASGEWGVYDVVQSGDCSLDTAESLDDFINLERSGNEFSFVIYEDSYSCSLTGQEFLCTSNDRSIELEEVSLQVTPSATGEFTTSTDLYFL